MATNPILSMSDDDLKKSLDQANDIVSMMKAGKTNKEIGDKYGNYPGTMEQALVNFRAINAELEKRGIMKGSTGVATGNKSNSVGLSEGTQNKGAAADPTGGKGDELPKNNAAATPPPAKDNRPRNILIGFAALLTLLGILKWQKVI